MQLYVKFEKTEARVPLKKGTPVFDTYAEAEAHAESVRSYVGRTIDSNGNFSGFYVPL